MSWTKQDKENRCAVELQDSGSISGPGYTKKCEGKRSLSPFIPLELKAATSSKDAGASVEFPVTVGLGLG